MKMSGYTARARRGQNGRGPGAGRARRVTGEHPGQPGQLQQGRGLGGDRAALLGKARDHSHLLAEVASLAAGLKARMESSQPEHERRLAPLSKAALR